MATGEGSLDKDGLEDIAKVPRKPLNNIEVQDKDLNGTKYLWSSELETMELVMRLQSKPSPSRRHTMTSAQTAASGPKPANVISTWSRRPL